MNNCPICNGDIEVAVATSDSFDGDGNHSQNEHKATYCSNKDCYHYFNPISDEVL